MDIVQDAARLKSTANLPFFAQSVEKKRILAKEPFLENDPLASKKKRKSWFSQGTIYVCASVRRYSIA